MADKEFEPDDPLAPVAVMLETPGHDGQEIMARCFIEEFALMGWAPEKVFRLFTIPEYAASHSVYLERGAEYVKSLITSVFGEEFEVPEATSDARLVPVLRRFGAEGARDATGS
jgi:hypothetical protein